MNRHCTDDVENKNSGKGETALQLVFSGEQGQVTKGWQVIQGMGAFKKKAAFMD